MKILHEDRVYDVYLEDDGSLDTVISVNGREIRFSQEHAVDYRDESGSMTKHGLRELGIEAIEELLADAEWDAYYIVKDAL